MSGTRRIAALAAALALGGLGAATAAAAPRIAFSYGKDPEAKSQIFTMRADGTHRSKVTGGKFDLDPAWSPSRKSIAYRHASCRCGEARIGVVRLSTGKVKFVTTGLAANPDNPDWMSGGRIVFDQEDGDGERNLFSVRTDGSELKPITEGGLAESIEPDWSPAAKRIVYLQRDENSEFGMFTIKSDGSGQKTVISPNLTFLGGPAWSPSGGRIAYTEDGKLCLVKADGSGRKCPNIDVGFVEHPSWSPDGKRIAFESPVSKKNGDVEIFTVKPGGKGLKRLTNNDRYDATPGWY